jgi:SAM-dependent methyltransferase
MNDQYNYMFSPHHDSDAALGVVAASTWRKDPKRLLFMLARYKFVAKMFSGFADVLEVGCGDAWASRVVKQHVHRLTGVDMDERFLRQAAYNANGNWTISLREQNVLCEPINSLHDGIYLLDVLEHVSQENEDLFLQNILRGLKFNGALIVGMPSLSSQALIPAERRDPGHINCKDEADFKSFMQKYFNNVFIFSMNDEFVHTGNTNMAHYLLALCCGKK